MLTTRTKTVVGAIICVGFVVFAEWYVGWNELLAPWREAEIVTLIAALLLVFSSYWMRTLRIYYYFRTEMSGAMHVCFKLMLQHNVLNNLLPMRTGEISFPVLMHRYFDVPTIRSAPALIWFRILDLNALLLIGLIALGSTWFDPYTLTAFGILLTAAPFAIYIGSGWLRDLLARAGGRRIRPLLHKILTGLPGDKRTFLVSWWWTLVNWIVKLMVFAWILRVFVDTSLSASLVAVIAGDLTSVLPIHGIAGVGTYEAGFISALLPYGVDGTTALHGAVNVHIFLLSASLLGGAVSLFLGTLRQRKIEES